MTRFARAFQTFVLAFIAAQHGVLFSMAAIAQQEVVPVERGEDADGDGAPDGVALWRIEDEDTILYLFGTVHVLPPELEWRRATVNQAFDSSTIVYFESDTTSPQAVIDATNTMVELGRNPPGVKLSGLLSSEGAERLERIAPAYGLPVFIINNMRPWLAAVTLGFVAGSGDPEAGVESVLEPEAKTKGKPVRYLEDGPKVLTAIAGIDEAIWITALEDSLKEFDENPNWQDELFASWVQGDVTALEEELLESFAEYEDIYKMLLIDRNQAWVEQLERLLAGGDDVYFVAVGAAHLAGEHSVQAMLAEVGYEAERW